LTKTGLQAMDNIARLLHVSKEEIVFGFTHRTIEINKETTNIPLKPHDAEASRDALAKSIYGQLFDWLVSRVNVALNGEPQPWAFIGLLDIFGFEIFERNSFEQLCINFTNEKLQQLFNRDTFQREQAMYRKEGVPFDEIKYIDNQPILDMIEKKAGGLLTTLDDMNRMPKSTDEGFVARADEVNADKPGIYITSTNTRKGKAGFSIIHYAGTVVYDASGFLVKNKDLLFADLYDAMSRSKSPMTAQMFPALSAQERSKYSLGAQFRQQLDKLMTQLNATQTHYIRCVKPNNEKAPSLIDPVLTLEQLRYSGVFEAVRIRKQGYPFRYTYERFVDRYKCLLLQDAKWVPLKAKQPRDKVAEILDYTGQDFSEIKMGATMALYRAEQHRLLELLRALALEKVCAMIQAIGRGYIARVYCRKIRAVVPRLEKASESRDGDQIDKALADYSRVVGSFAGLVPAEFAVVRKCKRIRFALKEWERLSCEVDELAQRDLAADENAFEQLKDCVWAMDALMDEPGSEWHMQMYDYAKGTFEDERFARMDPALTTAMDLLEREQLTSVYAEAKRLKFEDPRLEQIEKFMGLGEEELLKFQYKNAKKLGMADRAREKETRIRENFLDGHMDMFGECPRRAWD
jgi:myosin heavy subunit